MILLALGILCATLIVADLFLIVRRKSWNAGYEQGLSHLEEAVENSFRAGFRARELAGEDAVALDGEHVRAQRQRGWLQ